MRTTVDVPEDLLRAAKEEALRRGETLSRVVEAALQAHLAARSTEQRRPFRLIVAGRAGGRAPSPAELHRLLEEEERSGPT